MSVESPALGVRWTVGGVHPRGLDALRLSIAGARRLFADRAAYVVCVNSRPIDEVRRAVGPLADSVAWHKSEDAELPPILRARLDATLAEGVGWKFAPARCFPDLPELSLDNDCILWDWPPALAAWLARSDRACLMADDVRRGFGIFDELCGPASRNSGIRGLPAGFDLEAAFAPLLACRPQRLTSELDEQGLQAAALERSGDLLSVPCEDVTICSPFYPHQPHLGRCGAHFVGLNARTLPWSYYDRPATEWIADHWARLGPEVADRIGMPMPS